MRPSPGIRRVILVVLDGLRPDAIDTFGMTHIARLMAAGASTRAASTVSPSVTAAAMASLLTGVPPHLHGLRGDRFYIPAGSGHLEALPRVLAQRGLRTAAFVRELPLLARPLGGRVARALGVGDARFSGRTCEDILAAARGTLRSMRDGLVLLHWPDADEAGHASGWMSPEYGEAVRRLDWCLGAVATIADVPADPATLLVALADHGGGGAIPTNHDSEHPLDRTIPLVLAGGGARGALAPHASLLDVPATICWALGALRPDGWVGRPLTEAFAARATVAA